MEWININRDKNKDHWDLFYKTKQSKELSWVQTYPAASMYFLNSFKLSKDAAVLDVGGGDSVLADTLLNEGFYNITVLDISAEALERSKKRLGKKAELVKWVVSDVNDFDPVVKYDVWHDRAAFHFLTNSDQVTRYINVMQNATTDNAKAVMGTFSKSGPVKCSGLDVKQYDEQSLGFTMQAFFRKEKCITENHITPFNTSQHFLFCSFQKNLKAA